MQPPRNIVLASCVLTAAACGGSSAPRPISAAAQQDVVGNVISALNQHGFRCQKHDDIGICDQEVRSKPTIVVVYEASSHQLMFGMPFLVAIDCDESAPRLNRFNWDVDIAKVACGDGKLVFTSTMLVPETGLSASDVGSYVLGWSNATQAAMRSSGIVELMDPDAGGDHGSDHGGPVKGDRVPGSSRAGDREL